MSSLNDSVGTKQPLKRLEIPINKFNDVAIPHHLDLLRRHKNNIKRYQMNREWDLVRKEQVNAARLVKQLEQLLYEMDTLRARVQDDDIAKFDRLTAKSRANTLDAIQEYLDMRFDPPSLPTSAPESPEPEDQSSKDPLQQRQVQLDTEEEELERHHACLHSWNLLQQDVEQLHQVFVNFNQMIQDQRERVVEAEDNVAEAHVNVAEGARYLERASKYKAATYPIAGALIGTCLGGPVGMMAGLKLGGFAAIGGGLLGFTGATLLKNHQLAIQNDNELEMTKAQRTKQNLEASCSSSKHDESKESRKKL